MRFFQDKSHHRIVFSANFRYTVNGDTMKMIHKLLDQMSLIPINFQYTDPQPLSGQGFCFQSMMQQTVYGTYWKTKESSKQTWLVLFHGLGAHTRTDGYLDFVKKWLQQGYDVIGIDVRGQGGRTQNHRQIDPKGLYLTGYPKFEEYYYSLIYMDSYRLIDICQIIEPQHKIIANGGSQGGALALFVGAMHHNVRMILADMPSNTDIPYLITHSKGGFQAFLSHDHLEPWLLEDIDLLSYAHLIQKPILLASGSIDDICPLKTCESLYQKLSTKKSMIVYHGFGHGGYDDMHFPKKLKFIEEHINEGQ